MFIKLIPVITLFCLSLTSGKVNDILDWIAVTCKNTPVREITLVMDPKMNTSQSKLLHDVAFIALKEEKFLSTLVNRQGLSKTNQWINHLIVMFDLPRSNKLLGALHPNVLIRNQVLVFGSGLLNNESAYMNLQNIRHNSRLFIHIHIKGIYEVYRINPSLPTVKQKLLDANFNLLHKGSQLLHDRRFDLRGTPFRVGYVNIPAFNRTAQSGVWYQILLSLQRDLNFKIKFKKSPDNLFGSKVRDHEFNGMLGMIQRDEIDFSPEGFSITLVRMEAATFSFPIQETYAKLYVNAVNRIKLNWESFLKTFEWKFRVWILSYIIVFILFLLVIHRVHQSYTKKPIPIMQHILVIYFNILGLSYSTFAKYSSFRIVMVTVMLFGALLAWAFNATLVSILSSTGKEVPIKKLEDLFDYKDFQLIVKKGTSIEENLRFATETSSPVYHRVFKEIIEGSEDRVFLPSKVTVQKLQSPDKYVMLNEEFSFITNFKDMSCFIKEDSIRYSFVHHAWAYNPNFEYLELFDHHIMRMRESGIIARFYDQMAMGFRYRRCTDFDDSAYSAIDFQNIILIFILIIIGTVFAICVLLCEIGLQRSANGKLRRVFEKEFIG